jgi:cell division GTPase FtsZ
MNRDGALSSLVSSSTLGRGAQQYNDRYSFQYQQQRYQSDFMKKRALAALKSKQRNATTAGANSNDERDNNSGADLQKQGNQSTNNASITATSDSKQIHANVVFEDDHQLAGLAAAAKASPTTQAGNITNASSPTFQTTNVGANASSNTTTESFDTETNIQTGISNNKNGTVEANPWAHLQLHEFAPKIVVVGVGGAGTNAVNNMVASGLSGVEFLALNTDAHHLSQSISPNRLQIGGHLTSGLGCGANPDAGRLAAEESKEAIVSCIEDAHMVFITAGMGGGTGTGAAPVVAGLCYDLGILTVSVVTTPFRFEGSHRRRLAMEGVDRLKNVSDTLIVVPNQNLFRLVKETTSFVESFRLADDVLLAGVRSVTDLMTNPGMINLDFADVQR